MITKILSTIWVKLFFVTAKLLGIPKPTTLSGPGSSLKLAENIANLGVKKVQIVSDKILSEIGVLTPIIQQLNQLGVNVAVFDDVKPDPTHGITTDCLNAYKKEGCDGVLAIGGGSSIDVAKTVAVAVSNNKSSKQLVGILKARKPAVPLFVIPTTAGTGSEVTVGAVISDDETHQKGIVIDPNTVPFMVALDAEIMAGMPPKVTAETGLDALTHAVEAYVSRIKDRDCDYFARAAVKMIFEHLPTAYKDPKNMRARDAMALASHYGGLALNQTGLGYVHAIAHQLGANYAVPHGRSNAIVMPHVLKFSKPAINTRLAELAKAANLAEPNSDDESAAQAFIDGVEKLLVDLDLDTKVEGIKSSDFDSMVKSALFEAHSTYAVPKFMSKSDCKAVLENIAKA